MDADEVGVVGELAGPPGARGAATELAPTGRGVGVLATGAVGVGAIGERVGARSAGVVGFGTTPVGGSEASRDGVGGGAAILVVSLAGVDGPIADGPGNRVTSVSSGGPGGGRAGAAVLGFRAGVAGGASLKRSSGGRANGTAACVPDDVFGAEPGDNAGDGLATGALGALTEFVGDRPVPGTVAPRSAEPPGRVTPPPDAAGSRGWGARTVVGTSPSASSEAGVAGGGLSGSRSVMVPRKNPAAS